MRFIYEKEGKRFEYHIPEGNMIVGRDRKADISIFDNNISRHHITVIRRVDMVMIRDLGSRNGTFVNNSRVTEAELKPGDIVRLGTLSLFFDDGSPGLEIPTDLGGHMGGHAPEVGESNPTPVDGNIVPPAPALPPGTHPAGAPLPVSPSVPPPLPPGFQPPPGVEVIQRGGKWFLREPSTGREVEYLPPAPQPAGDGAREADVISATTLTHLIGRAKTYYLSHKTQVLIGLGVLTGALFLAAVVRIIMTPPRVEKRTIPTQAYDDLLDQGIDHFAEWIEMAETRPKGMDEKKAARARKAKFKEALKYFETIDRRLHERQTGGIMINAMQAWSVLPQDPAVRDWSSVMRYLDELVGHANVTPRAKEFGRRWMVWVTREANSRSQARYANELLRKWETTEDLESLKTALIEFRKLERDFDGTPAQLENAGIIPEITEKFRRYYEEEGDRRFNAGEWSAAIESFEKAKKYADEARVKRLDEKIAGANFQTDQDKVLPLARDLKSRGDFERLLSLLENVPDNSPIYIEAQRMMKDARYAIAIRKARDYYRQGEAANALRILSAKEFFIDPDFSTLREKIRKISRAMEEGDKALDEAMKQIREMEEPIKVAGFETARARWSEVKDLEALDSSNAFVVQAQRKLFDLTDEKIGALYHEKALALLGEGEFRKGRAFLDLARKHDLRLGIEILKEWRQEAGRKYNRAINLVSSDKKKARELLQWIVDVLRPGDSDYYEKAHKALAGIPK